MRKPTSMELVKMQYDLCLIGIGMKAFCFLGSIPWFEFTWDFENIAITQMQEK